MIKELNVKNKIIKKKIWIKQYFISWGERLSKFKSKKITKANTVRLNCMPKIISNIKRQWIRNNIFNKDYKQRKNTKKQTNERKTLRSQLINGQRM